MCPPGVCARRAFPRLADPTASEKSVFTEAETGFKPDSDRSAADRSEASLKPVAVFWQPLLSVLAQAFGKIFLTPDRAEQTAGAPAAPPSLQCVRLSPPLSMSFWMRPGNARHRPPTEYSAVMVRQASG